MAYDLTRIERAIEILSRPHRHIGARTEFSVEEHRETPSAQLDKHIRQSLAVGLVEPMAESMINDDTLDVKHARDQRGTSFAYEIRLHVLTEDEIVEVRRALSHVMRNPPKPTFDTVDKPRG